MKVSVIIPSYNHEQYVGESVRSVLQQDYPAGEYELIVIDDGSKDDSAMIIEETLSQFPANQTQLICQENQGVSRTLNRALELATGKYVMILASDDRLLPNALASLEECFRTQAAESTCAVFGDGYLVNSRGERIGLYSKTNPAPLIPPYREELLVRNYVPGVGTMYRYSALESVNFYDPEIGIEDWDMLLRLTEENDILRLKVPVFEYRLHDSNISANRERMSAMFATLGRKHPQWNRFYEFKSALKSLHVAAALRLASPRNIRLLIRLVLAQLRVLANRIIFRAGRRQSLG